MIIKHLGQQNYEVIWQAMQRFTLARDEHTPDELWIIEHFPIYTLGLNSKREHLLNIGDIPVIQTDRGGQVTYHGLGQLVVYPLMNIKRLNLNIRQLVTVLEQTMINTLAYYSIHAVAKADAPGVYVNTKKIGSIGLRIKNNACYHGLSLNNAMDLRPFQSINPCGYAGLQMTQLANLGINISLNELANTLINELTTLLPYES